MNVTETNVEWQEKSKSVRKEGLYYKRKMRQFGLTSLDRFVMYHPNPSDGMKSGVTYAHRDMEKIADAMVNGDPWAVVSGLNPSGPLHLGHLQIFKEMLWMQKNGAEVFIPITNDESYVVNKTDSLSRGREIAYNEIIPSIVSMGFDEKKTHIFVDSDYTEIYNAAMDVSKHMTLNTAKNVFGFDFSKEVQNPGTFFYRSAVQVAQILLPQYQEFGGPKPTVIPVGIDQHPYIVLARNVAKKMGMIPPAELSVKFLQNLDGAGKMSASRPESAVFLTDNVDLSYKKILGSYTGGLSSSEDQSKLGGVPESCPIYSITQFHLQNHLDLKEKCSSGKVLCGDCKSNTASQLRDYLTQIKKNVSGVGSYDGFMLKTPLTSIRNKYGG